MRISIKANMSISLSPIAPRSLPISTSITTAIASQGKLDLIFMESNTP